MSRSHTSRAVARLRTLAQTNARPHATSKQDLSTKLDRAIARTAARRADVQQLRVWAKAVKDRDQWKDRKTGVTVRSTRSLDPLRAEAHHIESRSNKLTRYDVRNGVTLSFDSHVRVERGDYRIEGTQWFRKGGQRFIDGTAPVYFVRT